MENRCVCCNTVIPEGRQVCPGCECGQKVDADLDAVIKKLESLRDAAFEKSVRFGNTASGANYSGQYTAYHKAIELIKKAMKGERLV